MRGYCPECGHQITVDEIFEVVRCPSCRSAYHPENIRRRPVGAPEGHRHPTGSHPQVQKAMSRRAWVPIFFYLALVVVVLALYFFS